ncbi:hypothetical protein NLG97_g6731 [Lecanicillium saksenae]|uniref:Uncharacterized protein n=1 Tax=Lecanicillium saksenae TaxID=468837 RepID=A0ACC1QR47_9HYPO|nr:hypothetical protein NLG97_g6731 [Lecanicillium saksenae]
MDPNFLRSALEGTQHGLQFPNFLPLTEQPAIESGNIKDFPFMGVCSKYVRGHACNFFASPYVRERRWDTSESRYALRKNLLCLITEANDYLQEKFGASPHLIQELPQLPPLFWPLQLEPDLEPYIYEPANAANKQSSIEGGLPFLYLCPSCRRIVWHASTGDVLDHWDSEAHKDTIFSVDEFKTTSVPNVDDSLRYFFESQNDSFRRLIQGNPELLQLFRQSTRSCSTTPLPIRLPCDQFTDVASEVWVQDSRVERSHPINWVLKATEMYIDLQVAYGSSPHDGKPVSPTAPRADVREIVDFRDRMAAFLRSKTAMLTTEPARPAWAPKSPLLMGQPYKCFSDLTSPAQHTLNPSHLEPLGIGVARKRSHSERSPSPDRSQGLMFYIQGLGGPTRPPKYLTPAANIPLTRLYSGWLGLIPLYPILIPKALALGLALYTGVTKPIPRSRLVAGGIRPANGTMAEGRHFKRSRRHR